MDSGALTHLRCIAKSVPPLSEKLQVCVGKDLSVWLVNTDPGPFEVQSGELFGFNVGSFSEKGIGGVLENSLLSQIHVELLS